jgi:HD-like signal output (HDOD) protein
MRDFHVLFIDDDPFMLRALMRTARRLRPDWHFTGCDTPELWQDTWSNKIAPDLIITDLQMPVLSGDQLLRQAILTVPAAMRVLLTGDTSENVVTNSAYYTHSIIAKPFSEGDFEQLFANLERLHALPLTRSCREQLGAFTHLPVLPELVKKLQQVFHQPEGDLVKIAELLQHEPLMAAKLMQIANSAFLGFSSTVTTLQEALIRLGYRMTEAIIMLYLLVEQHKPAGQLTAKQKLTDDSLKQATIVKDFARLAGLKRQQQEILYAAAVFSAIGPLLILNLSTANQEKPAFDGNLQPGFNNSTLLTVYLLTLWGYDAELCNTILWQDWPTPERNATEKHAFMLFIARQFVQATQSKQRADLLELIEQPDLKLAYQQLLQQCS